MENVIQKKISYHEFRELDYDDKDPLWYELIEGKPVGRPSPDFEHHAVHSEVQFALVSFNKKNRLGVVLHAPLDVVLDDFNAYHPDLFFIQKERYSILENEEEVVIGAPDLVIEILSKSTASDDKGVKKDNYEKFGVREYWLVDPKKRSFEVYALKDQRYKLTAYLEGNGILKSTLLEGFEMDIEKIFEEAGLAE